MELCCEQYIIKKIHTHVMQFEIFIMMMILFEVNVVIPFLDLFSQETLKVKIHYLSLEKVDDDGNKKVKKK